LPIQATASFESAEITLKEEDLQKLELLNIADKSHQW
jgi:hypothetical protein